MKTCPFRCPKDEAESCPRYRGVIKEDWMNSNLVLVILAVLSALLHYFSLFLNRKLIHTSEARLDLPLC